MSLIDESFILKCQAGLPVFIDEICAVYPAKLKEIATVGYDNFNRYLQVMTTTKPVLEKNNEFANLISPLTDYQYFLLITQLDEEVNQTIRAACKFFLHENVSFSMSPPLLIVGNIADKRALNEEQFYRLQAFLRKMYWVDGSDIDITLSEKDDEKTRAIKERMLQNRARVAKAKKSNDKDSSSDIELSDLIASVAIGVPGLNMINIWDLTYYAFHDQLKRMGWREKFDINNRAAIAGAKIKKADLASWIRSIKSDN